MKLTRTQPEIGRKYWWIRTPFKEPEDLEVVSVDENGIMFLMPVYEHGRLGTLRLVPTPVQWTWEEWDAAKDNVRDALPTVRPEDCGPLEEPCDMCRGTRWERTRDSDTVLCIWCRATGKREKRIPTPPTHTQRSPLHPKIPIRDDWGTKP